MLHQVVFKYSGKPNLKVSLVADFTRWQERPMIYNPAQREYQYVCSLPDDNYSYKFVVNKDYILDPKNPDIITTQEGYQYNRLTVSVQTKETGTTVLNRSDDPILSKLKKIAEVLKPFLNEEGKQIADACISQYEKQDIVIMVCGEVSTGKSSLLNTLIGKPILLTDLTETTAAITYLRSAEGNREAKAGMAKVTYNDGRTEWLEANQRSLEKVTTSLKNDDALTKVKMVEVYYSNDIIPPGITIVDTPGLNGGDKHSALTHREMGLCHGALFLLDASKTGARSEQQELQRLNNYAPNVFFVLSKWDTVRKVFKDDMKEIKRKYMFSIGRLVDPDNPYLFTDENIYVVSAKEGLAARQAYDQESQTLISQGKDRFPRHQDGTLKSFSDYLPDKGANNEIFELFKDMFSHLDAENRKRMLRQRPLLTLRNLAKEAIDELQKNIKEMEDTSELDLAIKQMKAESVKRQNLFEECIDIITNSLTEIAEQEMNELEELKTSAVSKVKETMYKTLKDSEEYQDANVNAMKSAAFAKRYDDILDSLKKKYLLNEVQNRQEAFETLLKNSYDLDIDSAQLEVKKSDYKVDFQSTNNKVQEKEDEINIESNTLTEAENRLRQLEQEIGNAEKELETCKTAKMKYDQLTDEINEVQNEIDNMPPCP